MWLMLQQDKPDDFVLATGKTWTIRQFIEKSFMYKGIQISWIGNGLNEKGVDNNGKTRIVINPKYYRPCEVDLLLGNPSKAENVLGWKRQYELEELIEDMFES
jgi:GDPmannose 4,6-dehydratase